VKLCNKHGVQYKASDRLLCTAIPRPNCIKIDLRRMNKIIEINEKSMYAVVEPM
jgi:FAD/FMN-containing dehydrogenase